jgi:hypothetical protein
LRQETGQASLQMLGQYYSSLHGSITIFTKDCFRDLN